MKENEKLFNEISFKENKELDLNEFYKELNKAIKTNNTQSIYELSKVFTRFCFKKLDN